MIARLLRTITEWRRNRSAERRRHDEVRQRAEGYLGMMMRHRRDAERLLHDARLTPQFDARYRLYARALAAECRAEACLRLAGCGPDATESAAELLREAADYDARGGAPRVVAADPVEAAHA